MPPDSRGHPRKNSSVPPSAYSHIMPSSNQRSPMRVVMKAFFAAAAALGL